MRLHCGDTCPKTGAYRIVDGEGRIVNTIYVGRENPCRPRKTLNAITNQNYKMRRNP